MTDFQDRLFHYFAELLKEGDIDDPSFNMLIAEWNRYCEDNRYYTSRFYRYTEDTAAELLEGKTPVEVLKLTRHLVRGTAGFFSVSDDGYLINAEPDEEIAGTDLVAFIHWLTDRYDESRIESLFDALIEYDEDEDEDEEDATDWEHSCISKPRSSTPQRPEWLKAGAFVFDQLSDTYHKLLDVTATGKHVYGSYVRVDGDVVHTHQNYLREAQVVPWDSGALLCMVGKELLLNVETRYTALVIAADSDRLYVIGPDGRSVGYTADELLSAGVHYNDEPCGNFKVID